MEIEANYIKEVSKVSKTNAVFAYSQTEEKSQIDYSNYSPSEIRDISYDEAKENYEQIKERVDDLGKEDLSESEKNELFGVHFQLGKVNQSNNEKLNEATYETMRNLENPNDVSVFSLKLQTNLEDYYYGKETTASFQINGTDGLNHVHKELNSTQLSNINVDDFIDKMLATFTDDYASAKSGTIKEQYKGIVDEYSSFKENYDKAVTEPYYA